MNRPWALPLTPLYSAAAAAHGLAYRLRMLRPSALQAPVISVGSLSAGGAGKTPVVIMLARLAQQMQVEIDVLSRGYKRMGQGVEEVVLDRADAAAYFGDEPAEMAGAGLRVFVGKDRFAAGQLAEKRAHDPSALVHLLDDGFQHRRLARQIDVVLVTREDLRDHLLPAGNLREPVSALQRADIVILRAEEANVKEESWLPTFEAEVRQRTRANIWHVERVLHLPDQMVARPFVFCGIARPDGFIDMLSARGVQVTGVRNFSDHHAYTLANMDCLQSEAARAGADGFLTTAKDAVKLTAAFRQRLAVVGPVAVAKLETTLDESSMHHFARLLKILTRPT